MGRVGGVWWGRCVWAGVGKVVCVCVCKGVCSGAGVVEGKCECMNWGSCTEMGWGKVVCACEGVGGGWWGGGRWGPSNCV